MQESASMPVSSTRTQQQVSLTAVYDDLTIVGPQKQAFKAFDHFTQLLAERGDLKLHKCRVLIPATQTPANQQAIATVKQQRDDQGLTLVHGCMLLLGGCVGSDGNIWQSTSFHRDRPLSYTHPRQLETRCHAIPISPPVDSILYHITPVIPVSRHTTRYHS